jgi:hypothetical protein
MILLTNRKSYYVSYTNKQTATQSNLKRGDAVVRYFVKHTRVHKYPVPSNCNVVYTDETLHDTVPNGYDKCDKCFGLPP